MSLVAALSGCEGLLLGPPLDVDEDPSRGAGVVPDDMGTEADAGVDAGPRPMVDAGPDDGPLPFDLGPIPDGGVDGGVDAGVDAGPIYGFTTRPANPDCVAPEPPQGGGDLQLTDEFTGVTGLELPIYLTRHNWRNTDDNWWVLIEQTGELKTWEDGTVGAPDIVLDDTDLPDYDEFRIGGNLTEGGLLGLAFDPRYPSALEPNLTRAYLYYTADEPGPTPTPGMYTYLVSVDITRTATSYTVAAPVELLRLRQPQFNHNGGSLRFGDDGYLYIGTGDGGARFQCGSLNTTTTLGKILRIDVQSSATPYGIPSDNPYRLDDMGNPNPLCDEITTSGFPDTSRSEDCPEIVAVGLRNPFRMEFDAVTDVLWIGDVGASDREWIHSFDPTNLENIDGDPFHNFGWPMVEGDMIADDSFRECNGFPQEFIEPAIAWSASLGFGAVGGHVYRGSDLGDEYVGQYFFADLNGVMFVEEFPYDAEAPFFDEGDPAPADPPQLPNRFRVSPWGFGLDDDGEMILHGANFNPEAVFQRVELATGGTPDTFPRRLSETGCFDATDPTIPVDAMIPYSLNAPFWSDGAIKDRYFAIPDGTTIERGTDGDWVFPIGTVLAKEFRIGTTLIETRLFMRHPSGDWGGYTYVWNDAQTDAVLAKERQVRTVAGQEWEFPSRNDCLACHTAAAGFSLGLETAQLNRAHDYDGIVAAQLETLDYVGYFTTALPLVNDELTDPTDTTATLEDRARAYLHTNCASCHRPGGPTTSTMDLRWDTAFVDTNTCNQVPLDSWTLPGATDIRIINPGSTVDSLLHFRPNSLDRGVRMPQIGSLRVDTAGVDLLEDWIDSLTACP